MIQLHASEVKRIPHRRLWGAVDYDSRGHMELLCRPMANWISSAFDLMPSSAIMLYL